VLQCMDICSIPTGGNKDRRCSQEEHLCLCVFPPVSTWLCCAPHCAPSSTPSETRHPWTSMLLEGSYTSPSLEPLLVLSTWLPGTHLLLFFKKKNFLHALMTASDTQRFPLSGACRWIRKLGACMCTDRPLVVVKHLPFCLG